MSDRQVISERPHTPISDYKKKNKTEYQSVTTPNYPTIKTTSTSNLPFGTHTWIWGWRCRLCPSCTRVA